MNIGFIGLGKLGLPVAVTINSKGHKVLGYDVNPVFKPGAKAVDLLPTKEADETGNGTIKAILEKSTVEFAENIDQVMKFADITFVAVQTPHDPKYEGLTRIPAERKDFDYTILVDCMKQVSEAVDKLGEKKIVIIISTVLPGTIRKYIFPVMSKNISLCYNPYFIAMGTTVRDFLYPEFILFGMVDEEAYVKARDFYKTITDAPMVKTTLENAELIKVAYNVMIGTKITFVNTLMEMCDKLPNTNVDAVTDALKLANRRLISKNYLTAGMGDGGGCHPRDLIAVSHLSDQLNLSFNVFDSLMMMREKQTEYLAKITIQKAQEHKLPICILGKGIQTGN